MVFSLVLLLQLLILCSTASASNIGDENRVVNNRNKENNHNTQDLAEARTFTDNTNLLYLKTNSGTQFLSTGFVKDADGIEYDLSLLKPYHEMFSDSYFARSEDGMEVTDIRSRETIPVSVFRANYDGGTMVQCEKDENGEILYCEIRRARGKPDMFLVRNPSDTRDFIPLSLSVDESLSQPTYHDDYHDDTTVTNSTIANDDGTDLGSSTYNTTSSSEPDSAFLAFTELDLDEDFIATNFQFGETTPSHSDRGFEFLALFKDNLPDFRYTRGDSSSAECTYFKVVNLAIVYDAEFCQLYGSFEKARSKIATIVASASVHYERDMCVRLKLTKIYTPETSLDSCRLDAYGHPIRPSFFQGFPRQLACATDHDATFLSTFGFWMNHARSTIGIDDDSAVHMFTGYLPRRTVGCAWLGTLCTNDHAYGVEYLSFTSNLQQQGLVLAHELAHNLNASHLSLDDAYQHVMEPSLENAVDGFSQISVDQILNFLDAPKVQCDDTELRNPPTPAPSPPPSLPPSPPPSLLPSPPPTNAPTASPSEISQCTIQQGSSVLSPICVMASHETDQYACVDASLLTPARLSGSSLLCTFSPRVTSKILQCDGEFHTAEIVNERKKKKKHDRGLRKFKSNDEEGDLPHEIETNSDCEETCVMVSNFVCFLANTENEIERNYKVTYEASAFGFPTATFETNVRVLSSHAEYYGDENHAVCHDSFTTCVR